MKFALYSDIHAQLAQLEAVQEAVDKENADKEIVVGDLVMLGPDPGPVVDNIRNRKNCDVIVGNLDVWVVDKRWEWMPPKNIYHEWMMNMAKGTRERLTDDQIQYLRMLPFTLSYMPEPGHEFFIFHGTPHEVGDTTALPLTLSDDDVKEYIKDVKADIMAHGHIHGPSIRNVGDQTIVCCAGVGMSWDGDPRPAYAIVEYLGDGEWHAETKRIVFDTEKAAQYNEESWIEHSDRVAKMVRTGYFWNPDHMPH